MKNVLCLTALLVMLAVPVLADDGLVITWSVADAKVAPGGQTSVQLIVSNAAGLTSPQNIFLTVGAGPYLTVNPSTANLAGLGPGGSQRTAIDVRIADNAVSTTSYVTVRAVYTVSGVSRDTTVSIPINIRRDPILQIENISYSRQPEPGTSTVLSFYLVNKGDGPTEELRVSMEQGTTIASMSSAGEVYVGEFSAGERRLLQFPITISPSATAGIFSLPFTLSYYNEIKSDLATVIKNIGIPIGGKANFIVSFDSGTDFYFGKSGTASISISNAGSSPAEFLVVKASSPYGMQDFYVGNLDSDDTQTVDVRQDLSGASGPYMMSLELSWKDKFGNVYSETKEVQLAPTSAPVEIGGGTVLIVLLIAGLAFWRRKKLMAFVSSKLKK
ncbi:MAG: hypothetical protein V1887_04145 [Candidatus Aenigmatarchaeota archaeon]